MALSSLENIEDIFLTGDKPRPVYTIKNLLVEMAIHFVPSTCLH